MVRHVDDKNTVSRPIITTVVICKKKIVDESGWVMRGKIMLQYMISRNSLKGWCESSLKVSIEVTHDKQQFVFFNQRIK